MRRFHWTGLLGIALLAGAGAQTPPANPDRMLTLTVYNKDLALVEHLRPTTLAAGRHRIEFKGVSARIVPQTVSFTAPGLELIEQNFDYDLLTPAKLMEKAVGQTVRIVRTNPGTGTETTESAEVLSVTGGVVLRIGERIEVLRDDGIPARVIFDKVPDNLRASPTLSVLADAARPVNGDIRLSYLSRGLSWASDYVAVFDEKAGDTSLQGWVTLTNNSGTTFENARIQLVAGDINIVNGEEQWWQRFNNARRKAPAGASPSLRSAGTETTAQPRIVDYYLYPLPQATTLANNQTKQVSFLGAEHVKADKGYEQSFFGFDSREDPVSAEVRIRFTNSGSAGLGAPLPAGVVRVYARDAQGQPQFVGEDHISHTSAGSELALKIGDAFDVTVQPTVASTRRSGSRRTEYSMKYLVRNARDRPVTVTVRQLGLWRFNEVREESIKGRRTDADGFAWDVPVPANGETELAVTIAQWW